ncbi:MAG: carboxypeptidase regulatory-like domain-containing protein [Candidatus Diapherotrites archaeon]|nr:carboxypeptidase regulatory-like domain-containing protein [Candidatus Diapherotrites archaeon]
MMYAERAFAPLFIILYSILLASLVLGAEVSGTIGDENAHAGASGDVKIGGDAYLANGYACTADWECYSGHCASDFDGSGSWCAPATSCAHDGTIYADGESTCYGTRIKETCTSGSWVAEACSGSCENGVCVGGATPTPTPPTGGGGAPGGGAGGAGPGASPTPTPETPTSEEVFHTSTTYVPSAEELEELLTEAGFSQEEIEEATQQAENVEITKELSVVKEIVDGEEKYTSTFEVRVLNKSANRFSDITIVESIPKNVAEHASEIHSLSDFRVLEADPVIAWDIAKLEPNEVVVIEYWVEKELPEETLNEVKTAFFAEKAEIVEEKTGSLTVTLKDEQGNIIKEPVAVELTNLEGNVIISKSSIDGRAVFENILEGKYYVVVEESANFKGSKMLVYVVAGKEKTVEITLESKIAITPTVTPTATPAVPPKKPDYTGLIILIILACLAYLGYYFWKKKAKPAKAKRAKRRRWAVEEKEHEEKPAEEKPAVREEAAKEKPAEVVPEEKEEEEKPVEEVPKEEPKPPRKKRKKRVSKFRRP